MASAKTSLRVFEFCIGMRSGYPITSAESGQKGLLGRAQKASAAPGCPIDFEQAAQFEFLPQGGAQQREEPGAFRHAQSAVGEFAGDIVPVAGRAGGVAEV